MTSLTSLKPVSSPEAVYLDTRMSVILAGAGGKIKKKKSMRRQKIYKETKIKKGKVGKVGKVLFKYTGPTMSLN